MIAFEVNDMTCDHCVGAITKAVKALDSDAQVQIDLAAHRVDIASGQADATALSRAIKEAGYTPVALEGVSDRALVPAPAQRSGCCCG
jgi:copper chaperone